MRRARAVVAVVFGADRASSSPRSGCTIAGANYENFLLIIAYWIGPWLGVVFVDRFLRRGQRHRAASLGDRRLRRTGPARSRWSSAWCVSIWLFSNQTEVHRAVPKRHPNFGDLTFEVGFVIAAVLYAVLYRCSQPVDRADRRPGRVRT